MAGGLGVTHRKLLAVGLIGSSIEWYDFFLYSTAAALAFPKIFFPNATPLTGTLLAFSTFWAGFLARPIGGVIAGHFGDRYGRKPVVTFCLWLMTASTFLIGCLRSVLNTRHPRSSRRRILPVVVLGSSSMNSIERGYL
jgi:MFS family permease